MGVEIYGHVACSEEMKYSTQTCLRNLLEMIKYKQETKQTVSTNHSSFNTVFILKEEYAFYITVILLYCFTCKWW